MYPSKKDAIGRTINYTLREKLKLPGSEQLTLVPLSDTFEYVVRDCIGSATGRVLVLTPVAQLGTLVLAFRGMRLHGESAEDDVGPSLDRRALAGAYPTDTPWQDDDGRPLCVHSGALGHLESAWSLGLRARLSALAHDEAATLMKARLRACWWGPRARHSRDVAAIAESRKLE